MMHLEALTHVLNRREDPTSNSPPRWIEVQGECPSWAAYASKIQSAVPIPVLGVARNDLVTLVESAFQSTLYVVSRLGVGVAGYIIAFENP
jgi:hypothetical protein